MWNALFVSSVALLTLLLIWRRGPKAGFYLMTALLPATGLYVDTGVSLSASKIISLILSFSLLATWLQRGLTGPVQNLGVVFLSYAAIVTAVGGSIAPVPPLESSTFRAQIRPIIQWISLFLQMLPLFLAPLILRTTADVIAAAKAFFWGTGLLALGGLLQWGVHWVWDFNIFPIYREGLFGEELDEGVFGYIGTLVFRVNSLAREPKDLGAALGITVTIWLLLRAVGAIRSFPLSGAFVAICLLAALLTFSMTAAFVLCIGVAVLTVTFIARVWNRETRSIDLRCNDNRNRHLGPHAWLMKPALAAIFMATCSGLILLSREAIQRMTEVASDILSMRVLDRVGAGEVEEYDQVASDFLANEPHWAVFGVGAGNISRYAFSYLPNGPGYEYMQNLTWSPKAGLLAIVTAYGLMGLCLLVCLIAVALSTSIRKIRGHGPLGPGAKLATVGSLVFIVSAHAVHAVDELLWLIVGVAVAYASSEAIQHTSHTRAPRGLSD